MQKWEYLYANVCYGIVEERDERGKKVERSKRLAFAQNAGQGVKIGDVQLLEIQVAVAQRLDGPRPIRRQQVNLRRHHALQARKLQASGVATTVFEHCRVTQPRHHVCNVLTRHHEYAGMHPFPNSHSHPRRKTANPVRSPAALRWKRSPRHQSTARSPAEQLSTRSSRLPYPDSTGPHRETIALQYPGQSGCRRRRRLTRRCFRVRPASYCRAREPAFWSAATLGLLEPRSRACLGHRSPWLSLRTPLRFPFEQQHPHAWPFLPNGGRDRRRRLSRARGRRPRVVVLHRFG